MSAKDKFDIATDVILLVVVLLILVGTLYDSRELRKLRRRVNALENALMMLTLEFAKRGQKQGEG